MDDIRKQYLCKGDGCQAALILPVDEDPSYYGWYQGYNTNDIWLWCPRHNPWVRHSFLGRAILEEARERRERVKRILQSGGDQFVRKLPRGYRPKMN